MLDATLEAFRNFVFAPLAADKCAEVLAALPDCVLREVCSYHYQLAVDQFSCETPLLSSTD